MSEQSTLDGPAPEGSPQDLFMFLDKAATKGWINSSSARALRTATQKVLAIDPDYQLLDLRQVDRDDQFQRFQTLKRNEYSDGSLKVYKSRFNQALQMYVARLEGDENWKSYGPASRSSGNGKTAKGADSKPKRDPLPALEPADSTPVPVAPDAVEQAERSPVAPPVRQIDHVFPLRDELDVTVRLPRDLTSDEADALATYIRSLVRRNVVRES
jgi:hypothetical protein